MIKCVIKRRKWLKNQQISCNKTKTIAALTNIQKHAYSSIPQQGKGTTTKGRQEAQTKENECSKIDTTMEGRTKTEILIMVARSHHIRSTTKYNQPRVFTNIFMDSWTQECHVNWGKKAGVAKFVETQLPAICNQSSGDVSFEWIDFVINLLNPTRTAPVSIAIQFLIWCSCFTVRSNFMSTPYTISFALHTNLCTFMQLPFYILCTYGDVSTCIGWTTVPIVIFMLI